MNVKIAEDRSLVVNERQRVETAWVSIDDCVLGCRVPMGVGDISQAHHRLLNTGEGFAPWPPIVGHWRDSRFVIDDGRHQYIAELMLGRSRVFVAWIVDV